MKKVKLLLLITMFTILLSSNILAEETTEKVYQQSFSRDSKYEQANTKKIRLFTHTNQVESEIYDLIYSAYINQNESIHVQALADDSVDIDQVMNIMLRVLNDHPEIFYVKQNFGYTLDGKVHFYYIDNKENIEVMKNELNIKIDSVLGDIIKPNMSEFERELAIHDYIVLNTEYDYENFKNNTVPNNSYNTYGTLMTGVAVCEGYAETFKLLLNKVGIESMIVVSRPMNHAWNIVTLDGVDYQVDVTWNDPVPDRKGQVSYKHLNLTDKQMKKNHNWTYDNYPRSTDDRYSAYWDIDSPKRFDNKMYYSSLEDDFIYSLDTNLQKQQITNIRAPYFEIGDGYIYFSNYSNGGYLSKISIDGRGQVEQLSPTHVKDFYKKDGHIYYTEYINDKPVREKSIKINDEQVKECDNAIEAPLNKTWTIKFNKDVDRDSINESSIYILDDKGQKLAIDYDIKGSQVKLIPKMNYLANKEYKIYITNLVSSKGKHLKEQVLKEFCIKK